MYPNPYKLQAYHMVKNFVNAQLALAEKDGDLMNKKLLYSSVQRYIKSSYKE